MKTIKKGLFLLGGIILLLSAYVGIRFLIQDDNIVIEYLPVFGDSETINNAKFKDSFLFTNQNGQAVTESNFEDCNYVVDFFFINCKGICPLMSNQMERVQRSFSNNPSVKILSVTVMPEEDDVPALKEYATLHGARTGKWEFVNTEETKLKAISKAGYLASLGDQIDDEFIHTELFTLVDFENRIRGFYDGTDSSSVDQLILDIKKLNLEKEYSKGYTRFKPVNAFINKLRIHGCIP